MAQGLQRKEYDLALEECVVAENRWRALQASIRKGDLAPDLVAELQKSAPRGLYLHFKGGLYVVETVVYDVEGVFDPAVDYVALYGELAGYSAGRRLYGPNGFLSPIDRPNDEQHPHVGRRFTRLRLLTIIESAKLRSNARKISQGKTHEDRMRRVGLALRP